MCDVSGAGIGDAQTQKSPRFREGFEWSGSQYTGHWSRARSGCDVLDLDRLAQLFHRRDLDLANALGRHAVLVA